MASFMDETPKFDDLSLETSADPSTSVALPEATDVPEDDRKHSRLVETIMEEFNRSDRKRYIDEQRWLECYRNYRGLYGPTTTFTSTEKSRAFIKITKTKVMASVAQMSDVLFAGNRFPIGIEPENYGTAVEDSIHVSTSPQGQPTPQGPQGPNTPKPSGTSQMDPHIAMLFGPKKDLLKPVEDQVKPGIGYMPTDINFEPAKEAAKKMERKILDQLDESDASAHLRNTIFEMALFGTGCIKGPFAIDQEYPRWDETGGYNPLVKTIPKVEYVSIWDCYPDADARSMAECEKFIQRHRLSKSDLRALKRRPYFRNKNIEAAISEGPHYNMKYWETSLLTQTQNEITVQDRWEVYEYWGVMDAETAKESKIKIPKEYKGQDQIQINAWICGSHILRLVFNPFTPARIPYNLAPYETNPYSIFGVGVAENMLDTQLLMNGFMRLAVDNAALSSNVLLEVNEDLLVPGQNMEVYPGKIFRRSGGQPGQAINDIHINDVSQSALALFDKARQLSDEATGMPSYAHGSNAPGLGAGRTAAGMSMLMGAAAQNIKAVVRNIDDFLLAPLGKALFAFNMQFNFDKDYIGDVVVVARGTESLMRNEIRSQRLLQLAQFAAPNPTMAPFIKWDYILREYAASLDLDEDKVINDPRAAGIQALQMKQVAAMMGQPPVDGQAPGGQGAPSPSDPGGNGNGNIGPGNSPEPGAPGFSSNQGPQPQ
jgi:hypothetical protein